MTPKNLENRRLVIVGAGLVGRALGKSLREAGLPVAAVISRSRDRARQACRFIGEGDPSNDPADAASGNLLMLATIDRVLEATAERIAGAATLQKGTIAFHCSGAFPGETISALRAQGALVGSLHPLQAFASPEEAMMLLPGSSFAVEGDKRATGVLMSLARVVGGKPVRIAAEDKAIYHAAAAVTSNSLVAVALLGTEMLGTVPAFSKDPFGPLQSLLRGTIRNMERLGPAKALTGPIVRGDIETVRAHIAALKRGNPRLLPAYRRAAGVTLAAAVACGRLGKADAARIERLVGKP